MPIYIVVNRHLSWNWWSGVIRLILGQLRYEQQKVVVYELLRRSSERLHWGSYKHVLDKTASDVFDGEGLG